jgi:hypothetical protein
MKNVLLYGGGTQSTGLLLMLCDEFIKGYSKPDLVIFADTFSEPSFVNDYIKRVSKYVLDKFDLEITIISKGNLEKDVINGINNNARFASLPLFMSNGGMIRRQCTNEYKIIPINKYVKELFKVGRKSKNNNHLKVNRLFGISVDEIERCRISVDWWAINKYPLVDARLNRNDVINYVNTNHPELADPPRSSCYFCPFHSNSYWKTLKTKHPNIFRDACNFDDKIRINARLEHQSYLHRKTIPLKLIDFESQNEIFGECEGYCGI